MPLGTLGNRLKGAFHADSPGASLLTAIFIGAVLAASWRIAFANPHRIHRWAVFLAALILYPAARRVSNSAARKWRRTYTLLFLTAACAALGAFIVVVGNHQFAAFDCGLMVDAGWRLIQGQIPYRDFIYTYPPAFLLGVKYGYQLFGVQWNAILYIDAIFASITFLWIYELLSGLLRHRLAAFLVALSVECAGVLAISYWWFNSIASVTATIFLLTCLRYLSLPNRLSTQASYCAALMLIGMMKPNTAFPMAAGGILLVFLATPARVRFTLLTVFSVGGVLLILVLNHISPIGLINSYRAVAVARGLSTFGFDKLKPIDRLRTAVYIFLLLAPGCILWWRSFRPAVGTRDWRSLSGHLLLLLGAVVGIFAMFTNGEMKDTDFPLLICFSAVLLWGYWYEPQSGDTEGQVPPSNAEWRRGTPRWTRVLSNFGSGSTLRVYYACFLCGLAISELYLGVGRQRIEFAEHEFFEWTDNEQNPGVHFFRNMRSSTHLNRVLAQAKEVVRDSPGSVFFGSPLEFVYAALGVPSPRHLPIFWYSGTAYAAVDEPSILETWKRSNFATLVYLRQDSITPQFALQVIREKYVQDDRWPDLTVFHAKRGPEGEAVRSSPEVTPGLVNIPRSYAR